VGGFGLGNLAKGVIESEFQDAVGAKPVRFSHGDFGFVVQALDDAAGNELLRSEIVENAGDARQLAVFVRESFRETHSDITSYRGLSGGVRASSRHTDSTEMPSFLRDGPHRMARDSLGAEAKRQIR
jgi:hypothetical protein